MSSPLPLHPRDAPRSSSMTNPTPTSLRIMNPRSAVILGALLMMAQLGSLISDASTQVKIHMPVFLSLELAAFMQF